MSHKTCTQAYHVSRIQRETPAFRVHSHDVTTTTLIAHSPSLFVIRWHCTHLSILFTYVHYISSNY